MLTPCLAYFVKVNLALALFFAFYRLVFYKDTFFQMRRFLLLGFYALAFLYPLFDIQEWIKGQPPMAEVIHIYSAILLPEATVTAASPSLSGLAWPMSASLLYAAAVLFLVGRFFFQLASIGRLWYRSRPGRMYGRRVRLLENPEGPFSFFRLIFLHPASYSDKETEEILTHEEAHVAGWHTLDVLISEWICILCWLNPFAWLLKREVRHNLEYLADRRVIEAGYDSKSYQYHLLGLTRNPQAIANLYTNFHVLHLKNRIRMMNKKRSRGIGRTKYLLFLPLGALLMLVSNIEAVARVTLDLAETGTGLQAARRVKATVVDAAYQLLAGVNVTVKEGAEGTLTGSDGMFELNVPDDAVLQFFYPGLAPREIEAKTIKENRKIQLLPTARFSEGKYYTVVDKMPRFPGGDEALLAFLAREVKYPAEARKKQLSGRVICSFIVGKDGKVYEAGILRGVHPLLDAEALRVIQSMPAWIPGQKQGEKVAVQYTVPINFSLEAPRSEAGKPMPELEKELFAGEDPSRPVYRVAEEMPRYPGGDQALLDFIARHVKYPEDAMKADRQGRVICAFIVEADGSMSNIQVMRGIHPSLDKEAMRVLSTFPRWTPGKVKGKPVRVAFTVPITFRLQ